MFDLRYHVASLAAVFLALVLGIVIGAAISDPSLADATENQRLERRLEDMRTELSDARLHARQSEASRGFAAASYEALVHDRLVDKNVLLLSVGAADERIDDATKAVRDAGGRVARMRALDVPNETEPVLDAIAANPALASYATPDRLKDLGHAYARELVEGGETPIADALSRVLVQQSSPERLKDPVDAVVIARSADPNRGPLAPFLTGLYDGLNDTTPAVGVELSSTPRGAGPLAAFRRADLSTVNAIDTALGKTALVVLLAGGAGGDYGIGTETVVPPIEPVEPSGTDEGA